MYDMIMEFIKNNIAFIIGTGVGFGCLFGAVPSVLGYVIRKVQDLIDIN